MTPDEARIFLKLSEGVDPDSYRDAFEEEVFAIRRFLLSSPTLLKTFQQKKQQLQRLEEAFHSLGGVTPPNSEDFPEIGLLPLDELEWHLMQYHQKKNELKQQLAATLVVDQIRRIIDRLIDLERVLAVPLRDFTDWTDQVPVIGRDMDAMQLLRDVREQADLGRRSIAVLWEKRSELPSTMLLELKRLSLLQNYLYEK